MICCSELEVLMLCTWAAILLTFESVLCLDVDLVICFVAVSNVWLRQRDV